MANYKREKAAYPGFERFVEFVSEEAHIACDPLTSVKTLKKEEKEGKAKGTYNFNEKKPKGTARTLASAGQETYIICIQRKVDID